MFEIKTRGFNMTFENGYVVSVVFAQNKDSVAVEIGAWDNEGRWIDLGGVDKILPWQSPDELLAVMNKIASMKG